MPPLSRRDFLYLSLAASAGLAYGAEPASKNVHQQILDLAAEQEKKRRARFAAVQTKADLEALQKSLRESFLKLIDNLPTAKGPPPVRKTGQIDADDYVIEKLVYESLPGYFVSAIVYMPKQFDKPAPGVISPCGHSQTGKAADSYQILHTNLVKRGYVVLTYDPVGQGERSQFWDAEKGKSRFNLTCGEHCVLGNPLYLLGSSLARYRIWDGVRAIDYLTSLENVDKTKIGCVGNSGGGTLTSYISALDPRVAAAAIGCYITTLPRRMGNRIEADPDSDPEQDIYGFVSEGIDHAGLLALIAPRPTLLACAQRDFFPIEGARESFEEAKHLYEVAGVAERIAKVEADERHGLTLPLRLGVYDWFERWLAGRKIDKNEEISVKPRPAKDLLVCADGQVNKTFQSRPLLPLALEEFKKRGLPPFKPLKDLLRLDADAAEFSLNSIAAARMNQPTLVCINGNETTPWQDEKEFLEAATKAGLGVIVVDPRGVGKLRPEKSVKGHDYADPLAGVEENIAYNAFLVGKSLLEMRVADVQAAIQKLTAKRDEPMRLLLCGRRDAALVALFAAALSGGELHGLAVQEMLLSYESLFAAEGQAFNAASIPPGLLRSYGDIPDLLRFAPVLRILVADGQGTLPKRLNGPAIAAERFTKNPKVLLDWLKA